MQTLSERIAALSPEQRARFEQQLFTPSQFAPPHVADNPTTIPRQGDQLPCLLSSAQQRLWFIQQLNPASPVYHMPKVWRLQGKLNQRALQQALDQLVARHAVLRTGFPAVDGVPQQVVQPPRPVPLAWQDLADQPASTRNVVAHNVMRATIYQPFDMVNGPMLHATLIRLQPDEHLLLVVIHHIATDAWSTRLLEQDFSQLYTAAYANQPASLPPLPIQYTDYSRWQRQHLTSERMATQLAYWQAQFCEEPPALDLPLDRSRTLGQEEGARASCVLPATVTANLRAVCLRENVTLFMALLAAFQTLLYRYTGQTDIVVGTPIANRQPIETEQLIGFFVNTLALRGDLAGDPTVRDLLGRMRQLTLAAYDHSEFPFEKLIEELPIRRDPRYHPLFQVFFTVQDSHATQLTLPELTSERISVDKGTAPFDLHLEVVDNKDDLTVTLYYKTALFEQATIHRMLGHFLTLLTAMVADQPAGMDRPLSALPLLTATERQQLLNNWNATQRPRTAETFIHRRFELHAERHPNQVALIHQDRQLTYGELNQRVNQLAHYLQAEGVGPDSMTSALVAICLPRSLEAAIAMLAVLKAGGAFICLDPTWPVERLTLILAQTKAQVLIAQQSTYTTLPAIPVVVDPVADAPRISQASTENLTVAIQPETLAYLVYTSGSTGTPKGIMATHGGVANYAAFMAETFTLSSQDRRLQVSAFGSEYFIADMVVYLSAGTTLVFKPNDYALSIPELLRFLTEQKITIASLPSAYWHQWALSLSEPVAPPPPQLRLVFTGMDVINREAFALWQTHMGANVGWVNFYGPAETTMVSTYYKADFSTGVAPTRIPIGRPIANTTIYLLDEAMNPVPIGVPGEIYIGGAGVALGYLHQPALTQEKFIPDPFSTQPGARLYRTGDLARYLPSGDLDFLGRKDHQVKVRGFRIELQEIETQLRSHPSVQETVVVAQADQGDKRLVAYVVPAQGETLDTHTLRLYLKQKLPSYMLPHHFVPLAKLPMTVTGKLDRLALPAPDFQRTVDTSFVAPRDQLETDVAAIWCEILQIAALGIHDNFFEWGGHSLLATRIVARVSRQFQVEFPLRQLFEAPTIAEMAASITQLQAQNPLPFTLEEIIAHIEALPDEQVARLLDTPALKIPNDHTILYATGTR